MPSDDSSQEELTDDELLELARSLTQSIESEHESDEFFKKLKVVLVGMLKVAVGIRVANIVVPNLVKNLSLLMPLMSLYSMNNDQVLRKHGLNILGNLVLGVYWACQLYSGQTLESILTDSASLIMLAGIAHKLYSAKTKVDRDVAIASTAGFFILPRVGSLFASGVSYVGNWVNFMRNPVSSC